MISQSVIIPRLVERVGDKFKGVEAAAGLVDALDSFPGGPRIYVLPSARRAGPNVTGTMVVRQSVACVYQVLIGFDRNGERFDDMDGASADVIDALVGWQAPGETNVMEYSGGGLVPVDLNAGVIFWSDSFVVNSKLRSV